MTVLTALDHRRLTDVLDYNPETGVFTWKVRIGRCSPGEIAGRTAANGYRYINVDRKAYLAHRLAWFFVHKQWPAGDIDHRDRNPLNCVIRNLRDASRGQNNANTGIWKTNTSGFRGVSWDKARQKWACYIWKGNRKRHLGYFASADEAGAAYDAAADAQFGEFATLNSKAAA